MTGGSDSKQRFAFPIQLFGEGATFDELPDEIHVVPTGKWQHPVYGEMEITSANVAEFVQNFRDKVRKDLPITEGHDTGMGGGELRAIGWFKELIDRGVKGLYAVVEWTEEGKQLLTQRSFKYFSPEFYEVYEDPETGEKREHVLVGGALTNRPYFKELEPVVAFSEPRIMNQFNDGMKIEDIVSKKPEDLSDEEKAFVKEHESELTDEQKETFKSAIDAPEPEPTPEPEPIPEPEPTPEPKKEAKEPKGKTITMSEAEVAALRTAADAGAKALLKIEASERKAVITKLTFSQANPEGRFLPKQEGALESFLKKLSESQRDAFVQLVGNMPKADASMFKEIGSGGATEQSKEAIAAQVKNLANEKVKASEGKVTYSQAVKQVYAEKPELKEAYDKALSAEA